MPSRSCLAYLEQACGRKGTALREAVEKMLANERAVTGDSGADDATLKVDRPHRSYASIGPYRLVERLGHGGYGVVWLAHHDESGRSVAIKIMRDHLDERHRRRFEQERHFLAAMSHNYIARLLDTGTTEDDRPFLAMEYVEGQPIDEYCNSRHLRLRERLELFAKVCEGVHHAHQNLVVHRDLKPDNILVTTGGVPKLLDFGIAKLMNPQLGRATVERPPGTLQYASPEQLRGDPITTAADIYSLGVILYEMVCGHPPYRVETDSLAEAEKIVREHIPERPSAAIARVEEIIGRTSAGTRTVTPDLVGRERETRPDRLRRSLSGDIDNIVLMAMRKEPQRRYSSAEQFAADIRRHLDGLPVIARPDTFGYRTAKFVRRHRFGVTTAAVFALSLTGATYGIYRTGQQAIAAEAQTAEAYESLREMGIKLVRDFGRAAKKLDETHAVRAIAYRSGVECLELAGTWGQPDPAIRLELAEAYDALGDVIGGTRDHSSGDLDEALKQYTKAKEQREIAVSFGAEASTADWAIRRSHTRFGDITHRQGDYEGSLEHYRLARALSERHAGEAVEWDLTLAQDLLAEGKALRQLQRVDEALELCQRAVQIIRRLAQQNPGDVRVKRRLARALTRYAARLEDIGEFDEARDLYEDALDIRRRQFVAAEDDPVARQDYRNANLFLGQHLLEQGHAAGAVEPLEQALVLSRTQASLNPASATARREVIEDIDVLVQALVRVGESVRARELVEDAQRLIEKLRDIAPDDRYLEYLAALLGWREAEIATLEASDEAEALFEAAIDRLSSMSETAPSDFRLLEANAHVRRSAGDWARVAGDADRAEVWLAAAVERYEAMIDEQPGLAEQRLSLIRTLRSLADLHRSSGAAGAARRSLEQALSSIDEAPEPRVLRHERALVDEQLRALDG